MSPRPLLVRRFRIKKRQRGPGMGRGGALIRHRKWARMLMIPKELLPRPNLPFFGNVGLFAPSRWDLRFLRGFDHRAASATLRTPPRNKCALLSTQILRPDDPRSCRVRRMRGASVPRPLLVRRFRIKDRRRADGERGRGGRIIPPPKVGQKANDPRRASFPAKSAVFRQ